VGPCWSCWMPDLALVLLEETSRLEHRNHPDAKIAYHHLLTVFLNVRFLLHLYFEHTRDIHGVCSRARPLEGTLASKHNKPRPPRLLYRHFPTEATGLYGPDRRRDASLFDDPSRDAVVEKNVEFPNGMVHREGREKEDERR